MVPVHESHQKGHAMSPLAAAILGSVLGVATALLLGACWGAAHRDVHDGDSCGATQDKLNQLLALVRAVRAQETIMMNQNDQILAFSQRLDTASTAIAAELTALRAKIVGTVDPATLTALDANIARLEALGVDPANPVPAV